MAGKKVYFPYEDKKVIKKEKKPMIQKNMDGNSVLIDTNIIIDYDKGKDPLLKKYFQTKKILVVSTITVFEYYSARQLKI